MTERVWRESNIYFGYEGKTSHHHSIHDRLDIRPGNIVRFLGFLSEARMISKLRNWISQNDHPPAWKESIWRNKLKYFVWEMWAAVSSEQWGWEQLSPVFTGLPSIMMGNVEWGDCWLLTADHRNLLCWNDKSFRLVQTYWHCQYNAVLTLPCP